MAQPPWRTVWRFLKKLKTSISSVQSLSCVRLFATPWTAACQASLSITSSWRLLKLMSIRSVVPSNHVILSCPLLLLLSIFPSITVFSNESVLHTRWPKYWRFSFSISPSNEYSGLISFRIDWLDLLSVQGTLKSLLQHHSSKAPILWHSVKLPYNPTIPLLGIYPEKMLLQRDRCTPVFIVALFLITRTWKQPRCPSLDEWIKKLW